MWGWIDFRITIRVTCTTSDHWWTMNVRVKVQLANIVYETIPTLQREENQEQTRTWLHKMKMLKNLVVFCVCVVIHSVILVIVNRYWWGQFRHGWNIGLDMIMQMLQQQRKRPELTDIYELRSRLDTFISRSPVKVTNKRSFSILYFVCPLPRNVEKILFLLKADRQKKKKTFLLTWWSTLGSSKNGCSHQTRWWNYAWIWMVDPFECEISILPKKAILYFHGGGFCICSPSTTEKW